MDVKGNRRKSVKSQEVKTRTGKTITEKRAFEKPYLYFL